MKDFLIALITGGVGLYLLFAGYRFARILIPVIGFISGLSLGASITAAMANTPFLGTVTGVLVGIAAGLVFALFAYLYYALAIVIIGTSLGYWLGSQFILLLGFNPGVLSVVVGVIVGAAAGLATIALRAPKYVLVVMTAIVGATSAVGAIMLLFNKIPLEYFSYSTAKATISNAAGWAVITAALALVGIYYQARTTRDYHLEEWQGGHVVHDTMTYPHTPKHAG